MSKEYVVAVYIPTELQETFIRKYYGFKTDKDRGNFITDIEKRGYHYATTEIEEDG